MWFNAETPTAKNAKVTVLLTLGWILTMTSVHVRAGEAPATPGVPSFHVVDVLVTCQNCDERMPWRLSRPQFRQGYGVVVGSNRVLTTEELIRQATLVELRQPGRAAKYAAVIRQSDPQLASALLEAQDVAFQRELKPVELAANLARGAQTRIVQYDDSGVRQEGAGRIVEIGVESLPSAPAAVLTMRVLSDLRVQNPGAPVYCEGFLAGIMMRYDAQHQTGFVLPAPVLARFLQAAGEREYLPPPSGGFGWTPLVDVAKRRYFGLAEDVGGVQVTTVASNATAAGVLQPNDVLLNWDGFAIDNQGYYQDPEYGRTRLSQAIEGHRRAGERVPVEFVREGRRQQAVLTLRVYHDADALVPENTIGAPPDYLVEEGCVIRELTGSYLRTASSGNLRLAHLYLSRAQQPEHADDRVVILAGVLPDPVNIGYQELRDEIVTDVNGKPVRNLKDVFRILERDHGIQRLTIQGRGVDVVLDTSQREAVNARIARAYRIPELQRLSAGK